MDQVHVIRHKVLVEGQSARSVAREMRVSRNTVRKYLQLSVPVRRESPTRARPVTEAVAGWEVPGVSRRRGRKFSGSLGQAGSASRSPASRSRLPRVIAPPAAS